MKSSSVSGGSKKQKLCAAFILEPADEERESRSSLDFATSTVDPKALQSARNLKSLDITFGRQE